MMLLLLDHRHFPLSLISTAKVLVFLDSRLDSVAEGIILRPFVLRSALGLTYTLEIVYS